MNFTHKSVQPKVFSPSLELTIVLGGLYKRAISLAEDIEAAQDLIKKLQQLVPAVASTVDDHNYSEAIRRN